MNSSDPLPTDSPPLIPVARPVGEAIVPAPASMARPAGFGPAMTRPQALIDVLLILDLFFFFQLALVIAGAPQLLMTVFPRLGALWFNVCFGVPLLVAVGIIQYLRRQSIAELGLARTHPFLVAVGAIIAVPASYVAVLVVVPLYLLVAGASFEELIEERSAFFEEVPELALWQAALFSAFVGLHEEVMFRGFILGRLRTLFRSNIAAAVVSSVVFGLLHHYQGPIGIVQTATVGMVLAMVVLRTGSLWPAILAHAAFDTIGLSIIPLMQEYMQEALEQVSSAPAG